jgi:formylglycine-generating enzyme required for sulfatase activity
VLKPTQNATRAAMLRAILEFAAKLKAAGPDAVGFLYYSGHGIASAGENYLIPVDVEEPSTVELSVQGVKHSEVLAILRGEAPNAAHYLVLDACRHTLRGARGGKGFVPVGQQSGVLVAFAAEPGKTASDIGQGSGPYAVALATELVKPGQSDLIMFHNVRVALVDKTKGDQVPWTKDGIQRRQRVLFGGEIRHVGGPAPGISERSREWAAVDKTSAVELETFVRRHASSPEADYARARIEDLKKRQVVSPGPKREQPNVVTGTLSCESHSERAQCELDTFCAWAIDRLGCQRKSGSLATAMLEALPTSKPTGTACPGVETLVGNEKRCLKPGDGFKDCPECPEMVVVPAGEFMMGSPPDEQYRYENEGPQHSVEIAKPFVVGKFEVTFAEWDACVKTGGCKYQPQDEGWGRGRRPVINVLWDDIANSYLPWLVRVTGKTYRLLTEAEWEYATRAGTTTPFSTGRMITSAQANFNGNHTYGGSSKGQHREKTVEVGSFQPNAFGLYDMHGNVWERVQDCFRDKVGYAGAPSDGSAVIEGECYYRVLRGGAWYYDPRLLRSAVRDAVSADVRNNLNGGQTEQIMA